MNQTLEVVLLGNSPLNSVMTLLTFMCIQVCKKKGEFVWLPEDELEDSSRYILTGRKHPRVGTNTVPWSEEDEFTRNLIAHYRSRVEIVIRRIKQPGWCQQIFRGSYELFVALFDITTLMAALEIRLEFDLDDKVMFEVVGPWQHQFYP